MHHLDQHHLRIGQDSFLFVEVFVVHGLDDMNGVNGSRLMLINMEMCEGVEESESAKGRALI